MPDPYSGKPANVEFNLPDAVAILSTTNATPIVVTNVGDNKCKPGDYVYVTGATDPNACGYFRAGTTTATTVVLLTLDGFNTSGSLVGGAAGTLQQAGYGGQVEIVAGGDRPTPSSVNVPFSALLDRAAWLQYRSFQYDRAEKVYTSDASFGTHVGSVNANVFTAMPGVSVSYDRVAIGDVLHIDFSAQIVMSIASGHVGLMRIVVVQDVGGLDDAQVVSGTTRQFINADNATTRESISGLFTVTTAGPCQVTISCSLPNTTGSDSLAINGQAVLRARWNLAA